MSDPVHFSNSKVCVSEWVSTVDLVFPNQVNPLGTLFGGRVLELMDINSSIACWRFCKLPSVTASTEPVDFRSPVYVGNIIEVKSRVAFAGRTSMIVRTEVYSENPSDDERKLCTIGHMSFVALGEDKKPRPVPKLRVETDLERRHYEIAREVKAGIAKRRAEPIA